MRRVKVNVRGRVQGVGFRYFTQNIAMDSNITGWVKNEDDGSVLIKAQGEEENISMFLEKIKKGPAKFARVQEMNVTELENPDSSLTKFEIK